MSEQKLFHAYDSEGIFIARIVATDEQFQETGYTSGVEPIVVETIAEITPIEAAFIELLSGETKTRRDAVMNKLRGKQ